MLISPAFQTLYAELVQQLLSERERPATIYRQRKGGAAFLYARRTVGAVRLDEYIGPTGDETAEARAAEIRISQSAARQRRKMVSALKRAGVPAPNTGLARILDAMSDAGLFQSGVLAGTAAYQCYSAIIGAVLPSASLMTQDADFATAELAIAANGGPHSLLEILQRADLSFRPIPGLKKLAPPSSFRAANGLRVDLLTPVMRRSDMNPMPLRNLSAGAVPLQYLGWLIRDPIPAVAIAGSGIFIRLPQPARYAVHKLIVARKRSVSDRHKRQKDLLQARFLIEALRASDHEPLDDALRSARRMGRDGWGQPIDLSLKELGLG
jgi:hypothetical protein